LTAAENCYCLTEALTPKGDLPEMNEPTWREAAREALKEAVENLGGQEETGKQLKAPDDEKSVPQSTISFWLNRSKDGCPPWAARQLEELTGRKGLKSRLRPDVYPEEAAALPTAG
jgi:hypothetical protein